MISRTFMTRVVTYGDAGTRLADNNEFLAISLCYPASAHGLDKGDLVDLFQSGDSAAHLVQRRFAQEAHALFAGSFPYLRGRSSLQNQDRKSTRLNSSHLGI